MKIVNNTLAFFILIIAFCACKQKAIPEIKRITPKQTKQTDYQEYIDCQQFDIQADEIICENGEIKALNDYRGKDKQEISRQVLLVWERGLLKQEIRKNLSSGGNMYIDTLNYKQVAPDTLRSIEGEYNQITDIILDSMHRIVGRIQYRNDVGGFIEDYCRFTRDAKGNKKEAVGVSGEIDQEGYKAIFDYLAFDAYGNWTKRRVRSESKDYYSDELYPFYAGKKQEPFLSFPVKLSAKPYEYIEERVIEYKEEGNWWDFIL